MNRIRTLFALALLAGAAACTAAPTSPSLDVAGPQQNEAVAAPEATTTSDTPAAATADDVGLVGSGG